MKPHQQDPAGRRASCVARTGLLLICACAALTLASDRVPLVPGPSAQSAEVAATFAQRVPRPHDGRSRTGIAAGSLVAAAHVSNPGRTPLAGPVPKLEPLADQANRPYRQGGREYRPMKKLQPFRQRGIASWYGARFHGRETAVGERYDMNAMSAAHPTLPLPSYVRVTTLKDGKSVIVRVNDRGPFVDGRVIDLSHAAARHLGMLGGGTAAVELDLIVPNSADSKIPAPVAGMQ